MMEQRIRGCKKDTICCDCDIKHHCKETKGFTLAEVLITLGIIGVVAALTMPVITENVQKNVLRNQFKKVYSTFSQAVFQAQNQLDMPVACSYWLNGSLCKEVCTKRDPVYNSCTEMKCEDGSSLPVNQNGIRSDCSVFDEELFNKVLKVVKFCENNALSNGCLTSAYKGTDKVKEIQNPNPQYPYNPSSDFSDTNIKNKYSSWILSDGTVIIKYGQFKGQIPVYTVDINGHKKPNKWGYDIFTFQLLGDNDGIKKVTGLNYAVEKGGKTTMQMIQDR